MSSKEFNRFVSDLQSDPEFAAALEAYFQERAILELTEEQLDEIVGGSEQDMAGTQTPCHFSPSP